MTSPLSNMAFLFPAHLVRQKMNILNSPSTLSTISSVDGTQPIVTVG